MAYIDQYYKDSSGVVHFLSAQDQANAGSPLWSGRPLPDPSWTAITSAQAMAIANPPPTAAQKAFATAAQGMTISVGGASATYAIDADHLTEVMAEQISILTAQTFADGSTTVDWPDLAGATHAMTMVQFTAFARAMGAYVSALKKGNTPAAPAAIA
jgi:hypothetical protein